MDGALAGITRGLILDPASELNTRALEPAIAASDPRTADERRLADNDPHTAISPYLAQIE